MYGIRIVHTEEWRSRKLVNDTVNRVQGNKVGCITTMGGSFSPMSTSTSCGPTSAAASHASLLACRAATLGSTPVSVALAYRETCLTLARSSLISSYQKQRGRNMTDDAKLCVGCCVNVSRASFLCACLLYTRTMCSNIILHVCMYGLTVCTPV